MSCINIPVGCKEEIVKAYIVDLKHINEDKLERGLKEKRKELNRLLGEEKHLRSEQKELLNWLKQKQVLTRARMEKAAGARTI